MIDKLLVNRILGNNNKLLPNGFEEVLDVEGYYGYEKVENERIIRIGFGKIIKNEVLYGLGTSISFNKVENILSLKFAKSQNINDSVTIRADEHNKMFGIKHGLGIFEHLPLKLDSAENIEKFKELVKTYIVQYSYPFFEYWTDWRLFLPFIETDDIGYVANTVFAGFGMKKKMIIWKLCSHPKYDAFVKERLLVYDTFISESPNDTSLKKEYNELLTFLKKLEKIKPIYEWDEKYLIAKQIVGV